MRYHVLHSTDYHYSHPVQTARHLLHLVPVETAWQRLEARTVRITPEPSSRAAGADIFGNRFERVEFARPHERLRVESEFSVQVHERPWSNAAPDGLPWEGVRHLLDYDATPLADAILEAQRMRFESPGIRIKRRFEEYAAVSFAPGRSLMSSALDLMHRIHTEFHYTPGATEVGTPVLEVFETKQGVCQDFAHLMIACLRSLGLAARYVSGYLRTDPPPGQPRMIGADASHAWIAVFVPELGWVEFDPTNDCLADTRHLVLGWGRDFGDVSPVRGVIQGGGEHRLEVGVTVTPLDPGD